MTCLTLPNCIKNNCSGDPSHAVSTVGAGGGLVITALGALNADKVAIAAGLALGITNGIFCIRIGFLRNISDLAKAVSRSNHAEGNLQADTQQTLAELKTLQERFSALQTRLQLTEEEKNKLIGSMAALQEQLKTAGGQCQQLDTKMEGLQAITEQDSGQLAALRPGQELQIASLHDVAKELQIDTSTLREALQRFSGEAGQEEAANNTLKQLLDKWHEQNSLVESLIAQNASLRGELDESTKTYQALALRINSLKALPPSPHEMK